MPLSAIHQYMDMLDRRQAEYRMMMGEAASVPYMDEEKYRLWHESVRLKSTQDKPAEITTPNKLASIGVKVNFVRINEQSR